VDGQRVVYTLSSADQIEMVELTLGATSDTYSQVLDGDLEAGDRVIINPPASLYQENFGFGAP
jgi:HlyD family secretion protein